MSRDPRDLWRRFVDNGRRAQGAVDAILLENDWQGQVEQYAALCGWTFYHTHDSRGSHEGFPDLVMIRLPRSSNPPENGGPPARLVVAELKRETEDVTPEQQVWLDLFAAVGAEVFIWRPSNFDGMTRVLR